MSNLLKVRLSGSAQRLTCKYCLNPFKSLAGVLVVIKNKEGASLAHQKCAEENMGEKNEHNKDSL